MRIVWRSSWTTTGWWSFCIPHPGFASQRSSLWAMEVDPNARSIVVRCSFLSHVISPGGRRSVRFARLMSWISLVECASVEAVGPPHSGWWRLKSPTRRISLSSWMACPTTSLVFAICDGVCEDRVAGLGLYTLMILSVPSRRVRRIEERFSLWWVQCHSLLLISLLIRNAVFVSWFGWIPRWYPGGVYVALFRLLIAGSWIAIIWCFSGRSESKKGLAPL